MISVIVPFNKECCIEDTVAKIYKSIDCEVTVSDGRLGKGYALKEGTIRAKGDIIVWIDADLQIHPKEIKTFLKIMDLYDADAVIGNKRHQYSTIQYSILRNIISRTYNWLVCILFGFSLRDTQCGLKVFKSEPLKLILNKIATVGFAFDLEILVALIERGYRIVDAPIMVTERIGIGSATPVNIWITFMETIKIWVNKKKGVYSA